MYTVRIFDTAGNQDTSHETDVQAFAAVYVDELPLPATAVPKTTSPFAIYRDGVCFHHSGEMAVVGDPL